jgi:hypothetical protein
MPSDLIRRWTPVRVKKTRQNKGVEPGSDSSEPIGSRGEQGTANHAAPGFTTFGLRDQAERSLNLRDDAFRRASTASASPFSADTVVSQSMQPSVMLWP